MSLFLGEIHYWLYNKIIWFEKIEEEIIMEAKKENHAIDDLVKQIHDEYGFPMGKEPLEEIIDTFNIHGWLQQRMESAELRQAALITGVLKWKPEYKEKLLQTFSEQGEEAARAYENSVDSPEDIFNALNDYLLEGMPCDRVNEIVTSNKNEFSWKTTTRLHKDYWLRVGGDVQNFYDLREAWVRSFVKNINAEYKYEKSEKGLNRIIKQK